MFRTFTSILFILFAGPAIAQACPDFYRFVDFGLIGQDGEIYRGGLVFRAEGFEGQHLLALSQTKCLDVQYISEDGHGNPIPVVTSVNFVPEVTKADLTDLQISVVDDAEAAAERNSVAHRAAAEKFDQRIVRGADFLCVPAEDTSGLSCQVRPPLSGNAPLIVYCEATKCDMPVLALDKRVVVSSSWSIEQSGLEDTEAAGVDISEKVKQIFGFLEPLTSAF